MEGGLGILDHLGQDEPEHIGWDELEHHKVEHQEAGLEGVVGPTAEAVVPIARVRVA